MAIRVSFETLIEAIPEFSGDSEISIEEFLESFDLILNRTDLADIIKKLFVMSKIIGNARERIRYNMEISEEKNYEELKKKLKGVFTRRENVHEALRNLMSVKQRVNQSVGEFAIEIHNKAEKCWRSTINRNKPGTRELIEEIKLSGFINGISSDLAFEIRKTGVKTFEEALKIAMLVEYAQSFQNKEINAINFTHIEKRETDNIGSELLASANIEAQTINDLKDIIEEVVNKIDTHRTENTIRLGTASEENEILTQNKNNDEDKNKIHPIIAIESGNPQTNEGANNYPTIDRSQIEEEKIGNYEYDLEINTGMNLTSIDQKNDQNKVETNENNKMELKPQNVKNTFENENISMRNTMEELDITDQKTQNLGQNEDRDECSDCENNAETNLLNQPVIIEQLGMKNAVQNELESKNEEKIMENSDNYQGDNIENHDRDYKCKIKADIDKEKKNMVYRHGNMQSTDMQKIDTMDILYITNKITELFSQYPIDRGKETMLWTLN